MKYEVGKTECELNCENRMKWDQWSVKCQGSSGHNGV